MLRFTRSCSSTHWTLPVIPLASSMAKIWCELRHCGTAQLPFLQICEASVYSTSFSLLSNSFKSGVFPFPGAWGPGAFFAPDSFPFRAKNTASPPWCQIQSQNLGFLWRFHKNGVTPVTPKSSILIGCSIINHPAIGDSPLLRNPFIEVVSCFLCSRWHKSSSRAW